MKRKRESGILHIHTESDRLRRMLGLSRPWIKDVLYLESEQIKPISRNNPMMNNIANLFGRTPEKSNIQRFETLLFPENDSPFFSGRYVLGGGEDYQPLPSRFAHMGGGGGKREEGPIYLDAPAPPHDKLPQGEPHNPGSVHTESFDKSRASDVEDVWAEHGPLHNPQPYGIGATPSDYDLDELLGRGGKGGRAKISEPPLKIARREGLAASTLVQPESPFKGEASPSKKKTPSKQKRLEKRRLLREQSSTPEVSFRRTAAADLVPPRQIFRETLLQDKAELDEKFLSKSKKKGE